jgi:hypothetical protein
MFFFDQFSVLMIDQNKTTTAAAARARTISNIRRPL